MRSVQEEINEKFKTLALEIVIQVFLLNNFHVGVED
jgi:hypothetical protein